MIRFMYDGLSMCMLQIYPTVCIVFLVPDMVCEVFELKYIIIDFHAFCWVFCSTFVNRSRCQTKLEFVKLELEHEKGMSAPTECIA